MLILNNEGKNNSKGDVTGSTKMVVDIRVFAIGVIVAMSSALSMGFIFGPRLVSVNLDIASFRKIMGATKTKDVMGARTKRTLTVPENLTAGASVASAGTASVERSRNDSWDFVPMQNPPSALHALVDISGIESDFLDSEERLIKALINTVEDAGLSILSHHCHKLMPSGISCVGICVGSRISFHTWPEEGVITLDLFASDTMESLVPTILNMEKNFGVGEDIYSKWSHEFRGFREQIGDAMKINPAVSFSDMTSSLLSPLELTLKRLVYSNSTRFQRVDIWDSNDAEDSPSYEEAIRHNLQPGDPRWSTPELVEPERIAYHDGDYWTSSISDNAEFYESLVHPAMFAHPNPANIAVIGGADGAALREVLKHNTVQSATLIEEDEELIDIYKNYMPQLSDCSSLIGRANDCFEDDLVTIVHENYVSWLTHRGSVQPEASPLDVVIVNIFKANEAPKDFFVGGYSELFVSSLMENLSDEGVALFKVGTAPDISQPKADIGVHKDREKFFNMLENHPSVAAMIVFEEFNFMEESNGFLLVCKNVNCRSRWYARSDIVEFEMYERLIQTDSEYDTLLLFDGTTQRSYQTTPKAWETIYCRREPIPFECKYRNLDPKMELHELYLDSERKVESSFALKVLKNDKGDVEGPYVFATVDIPKGSYIMSEHLSRSFTLTDKNLDSLRENIEMETVDEASIREHFAEFIDKNIHPISNQGSSMHFVEIGGSVLIRSVDVEEEANIGRWVPTHPFGQRPVYSPVYDRHQVSFDVFMVATKDIAAGDEVLKYNGMWE